MKTRSRKVKGAQKKRFAIPFFILLFFPVLLSIPFILSFSDWFAERQISKFGSPDRLIFVQSGLASWLLVAIPVALIFCSVFHYDDKRNKRRVPLYKNSMFWGVVILLAGSVIVWNGFYNYTEFTKGGIKIRNGLIAKESYYDWESIGQVTVAYRISKPVRSNAAVIIKYNLHFEDGRVVNLYNSPEFFTHVLKTDRFLRKLEIPMQRNGIRQEDYHLFVKRFEGPGRMTGIDRLEVLREVFCGIHCAD